MVSYPQTQNQERLPVTEQIKNVRTYLFRLASELTQALTGMDKKIATQQKEIDELKRMLSKYEGR